MITLYLLCKNNVKRRTIIKECFYTSTDQALILQKQSETSVPSDYFVETVTGASLPISVNGTLITTSTANFLLSPFVVSESVNPAFAIETNTNNKLNTFAKTLVLGGKEYTLPVFPTSLTTDKFIDSLLDLLSVTLFVEGSTSYILPDTLPNLDKRVEALRTEAEMFAFQVKIENFTRAVVEILRTFIFDHLTSGGTVDTVIYTTTTPKQNLIRAAIEDYIKNNYPF